MLLRHVHPLGVTLWYGALNADVDPDEVVEVTADQARLLFAVGHPGASAFEPADAEAVDERTAWLAEAEPADDTAAADEQPKPKRRTRSKAPEGGDDQ